MKIIFCSLLMLLLSGCGTIKNPFSDDSVYSGISPPKIHVYQESISKKEPISKVANKIKEAELDPFDRYYAALREAKSDPANPAKIQDYVNKGVTLVNESCRRWFDSLAEAQIRFGLTQNNQNVIQNLGTTLLGFGKANSLVTGTYGAAFTALNGFEGNFAQSFLIAPNSEGVKEHIFSALNQRANQLLGKRNGNEKVGTDWLSDKPTDFDSAYRALSEYAGICTQQTARKIVNAALGETTTKISANDGGQIAITPKDGAIEAAKVAARENAEIELKKLQDQYSTAITIKNAEMTASKDATEKVLAEIKKSAKDAWERSEQLAIELDRLKKENAILKDQIPK